MNKPKKPGRKLSPWAKIYLASKKGTGCKLSSKEVQQLSLDDAIMRRGELDAVIEPLEGTW